MESLVTWLQDSSVSQTLLSWSWLVPTAQTIHIFGICLVVGSLLMINLRVLGWGGPNMALSGTVRRFAPWLWFALIALVITGVLLILSEPRRELMSLSFWLKMGLLAIGILIAIVFQVSLHRNETWWQESAATRRRTKILGITTLVVWLLIVILGRLIAFDTQVWGELSPMYIPQ